MSWQSSVAEDVRRFLSNWGRLLVLVAAAVWVGYLFERVVLQWARRRAAASKSQVDDAILRALHPALVLLLGTAALWFGLTYLGPTLDPTLVAWVRRLSFALILLLFAFMAARLLAGILQVRASGRPQWQPVARMGGRAGSVLIYVLALLLIFDYYGLSITPLLTSLGLVGLAVALALQDTLTNFFAGLWMQAGRALRPGHYIKMEEPPLEGYVQEIGWRTAKILTLPNNIIIVPNSRLAQSIVTDYHLPSPRMALLIPIQVGYEADPARVQRILVEEARAGAAKIPGLLAEPEPFVRFIPGFGDYGLQFTLICQVREFVDQFVVQHELRLRILERFRREGIRIPYPVRESVAVPATRLDVLPPKAGGSVTRPPEPPSTEA